MGPGRPPEDAPVIPQAGTTFAIRLYKDALGKGLSFPYTLAILAAHRVLHSNRGVWLDALSNNLAALKTYERAGFFRAGETEVEQHKSGQSRVYMVLGKWALA